MKKNKNKENEFLKIVEIILGIIYTIFSVLVVSDIVSNLLFEESLMALFFIMLILFPFILYIFYKVKKSNTFLYIGIIYIICILLLLLFLWFFWPAIKSNPIDNGFCEWCNITKYDE